MQGAGFGYFGRFIAVPLLVALVVAAGLPFASAASASTSSQTDSQLREALYTAGPSFNVKRIVYPSAHDFDSSAGIDTCIGLSVPAGDTFTLSLEWRELAPESPDAGDLDLYIYLDSACTDSALLTSSFNSNAYTGELIEITPQVRNIGSETAVAGVRIGKRFGRGQTGLLQLRVLTGDAVFLEHGDGPPLGGQEGAPVFEVTGPFSVPENSPAGTVIGAVVATDPQSEPITYFELEPADGQTSFQIHPATGEITIEDPLLLDRESASTLVYWVGATDGVKASVTNIEIDLTGIDDNAPIGLDQQVFTAPGIAVSIVLQGFDADIDPQQQLALSINLQPASGTLSVPATTGLNTAEIVYTPNPGFTGTDAFTFTAFDGLSFSEPALVTITVSESGASTSSPAPSTGTGSSGGGGGFGGFFAPTPTPDAGLSPAFPPSVPRSVQALPQDRAIAFTWQPPLDDGGAPIEGYRIFNVNTATAKIIRGDVLEGLFDGLENGTPYLFQVRAFNAAGYGESAIVGPAIPTADGPAIIDVRSTLHPDDTVSVWWMAPSDAADVEVAEYHVTDSYGELIDVRLPHAPLIVTVDELVNDAFHTFYVTGFDEEDQVVAIGETAPIYVPPLLVAAYDPMPPNVIPIVLSDQTHSELQLALQELAGGEGLVGDQPVLLTLRDGVADVFVAVTGLHRAVVLQPGLSLNAEQLGITDRGGAGFEFDLEVASGVRLSGSIEFFADPSGVLFRLTGSEVRLIHSPAMDDPISRATISAMAISLVPGFVFDAADETPSRDHVVAAIDELNVGEPLALVSVERIGIVIDESLPEVIELNLDAAWYEEHDDPNGRLQVVRIDPDGNVAAVLLDCSVEPDAPAVLCTAGIHPAVSGPAVYALLSTSELPEPTPTPPVQNAPIDPTPTTGPTLVVVKETPTAEPVLAVQIATAVPSATPTPQPPVFPESSSGGTTVLTWLMTGMLGLVILRGVFYAVGRLKG